MRSHQRFALIAIALAVASVVVWARPFRQTFHGGIEMVQIGATVLDKEGHIVRGLTAKDFTILEDGKPQTIVTFEPMDMPDPPAAASGPTPWTRAVAPDVQTNALPDGRLFVLFMDDAMLPLDPRILENAKQVGRSMVARLGLADEMAVVFSEHSGAAQNFTSDRAKLLKAVEGVSAGSAEYDLGWSTAPNPSLVCGDPKKCILPSDLHPVWDGDDGVRMRAFRTLQDIAEAFSETPERRKTLVYVSPGVTVNFSDANSPVLASGTGRGMASHVAAQSLASGVAALMHEFERNNVTVYAVDPAGSAGLEAYIAPRLRNIPALTYAKMAPVDDAGHVPLGTVPLVDSLAHFEGNLGRDFLQITADSTGGHAFINTSDFEGALSQILRETSSYYWIGYAATDPGSGKMHRLSVKVDRPGVEVRTRNIYYASDAKAAAKEAKASPVSTAMAGVLPRAEVPLGVVLAPFAAPGPTGATVAIVLGVTQPAPPAETTSQVDLLTRAYTADGQFRGVHAQTAEVTIRPGGPNDVARYEVLSRIDLKPGRYQLRLAAHSTTDARTGSVFADVEVPDFAKALVSLSGVLFEATPSIADAPRDALVGIVPIVPTAERGFDRSAKANAFVRVYQGGTAALAPIALAIRIVDATGVARLDRHETIAASSFDAKTRSVDERVALPLATLPAGDLLLTVEVRLSQTAAERQVRFTVR